MDVRDRRNWADLILMCRLHELVVHVVLDSCTDIYSADFGINADAAALVMLL